MVAKASGKVNVVSAFALCAAVKVLPLDGAARSTVMSPKLTRFGLAYVRPGGRFLRRV